MTLKRGHDLPNDKRKKGHIPVVSSSGITGYHNEAKASPPGIVTGRYGTLGEVFYLEQDYWPLNTALYVIDFKKNDPRFSAYFLKNTLKSYRSDKAAVPGIDRKVLHAIKVKAPDINIQTRIVDILSTYDDLIENNKRRIALLEESARQLYKEWFVRFRFPGHEHVKIVDGVPEGWTAGTISDFYKTSSGGTPSRKIQEFYTGQINWVKTQELNNGFIFETIERITEEAISKSSAKLYPSKTVLVAMYGATIGQLGILANPGTCNQACCALIPECSKANYIYAFLFLKENKNGLINLGKGSAQNNISQEIIKLFPMKMPPTTLMTQFADYLLPIFRQIEILSLEIIQLAKVRDLLLPKLMNGKITV